MTKNNQSDISEFKNQETYAEKYQKEQNLGAMLENIQEKFESEETQFTEIQKEEIIDKKVLLLGWTINKGQYGEYASLILQTEPESKEKICFINSKIVIDNLKEFNISEEELPTVIKIRKVIRKNKPDYYTLK